MVHDFNKVQRGFFNKVSQWLGKLSKWKLQLLAVIVIIFLSFAFSSLLVKLRKEPVKIDKKSMAPLVKVETVELQDIQMIVEGYGTVGPKVEVEVVPQVSGKIVEVNPEFKQGGFVRAGEIFISIDPRDYELAVRKAEADVVKAEVALDIEKGEAEVARQEWQQLNPGKEPPSALIVREPQIRQAQTNLEAAKANLASARLNLERTKISVPFDGRVVRESADLGQFVSTGQSIGRVYSIEAVEIEVPLEDWELRWFDIPSNPVAINGDSSAKVGSKAQVKAKFAAGEHEWDATVVRTVGQVDKTSRMISVVVEVPEPFREADDRPPLMPGIFVEVLIKGKILNQAIPLKRDWLHERNKVWVVKDGQLFIREVQIVREDKNYAYVVSGLEDNAKIVVSSLDIVTDRMEVRTDGSGMEETDSEAIEDEQAETGGVISE